MDVIYSSNYPIISDGYNFQAKGVAGPICETRKSRRITKAWRFFLSLPARIWRAICFKVILITVLAMFSGFCAGVVIAIDAIDEVAEESDAIELLVLNEVKI